MSNFAYTPRFDGIHTDVALPGRDPITGQFVSGTEADKLDDGPTEKALGLSLETPEERDLRIFTEDPSDPLTGEDDRDWIDDSRRLDEYYDDRDYWCEYLGLEFDTSLGEETEAWAAHQYGHLAVYDNLDDQFADVGEMYTHLPTFEARRHTLIASSKIYWCAFEQRDYRYYVNSHGNRTQKGRPSRFNKRNRVCENHIRSARRNTKRQMDNVWLAEMIEPTFSWTELSRAHALTELATDDAETHLEEINEQLWAEYEYGLLLTEQHWQHHHTGPMTEELQNCHGFNGDPYDEPLPEPEYQFDPLRGEFYYDDDGYDFWGVEYYDDYPEDEAAADYDFSDYPELRITPEEWVAMEAEELEEELETEAAAEALEFEFEHLAAGNAVGRRMQLAARAA